MSKIYTAIGLMSGTSCDGIDVSLLRTDGKEFLELLEGSVFPYDLSFQKFLKSCLLKGNNKEILELEQEITRQHAGAVQSFLSSVNVPAYAIDFLGFHGQTVVHLPHQSLTQQIGNASLLAELTKISVVADFRRRDMACGGQGAPLVPIFHKALARLIFSPTTKIQKDRESALLTSGQHCPTLILNIGGISNLTYIDADHLIAFDVGPGNALIDDYIFTKLGLPFDKGGAIGATGTPDKLLCSQILNDTFFSTPPPKSLDKNQFSHVTVPAYLSLADVLATFALVIAESVKHAIFFLPAKPHRIIVCGGGRHNVCIMQQLKAIAELPVHSIDYFEIDGDLIEAYAFGYLAIRSILGLPLTFPSTTGTNTQVTGGAVYHK